MTVELSHPLVADYLRRLDAAAAALPPSRRADLMTEIRDHLTEALGRPGVADGDDVAVRGVLDRLGAPEDIVAAEHGHDGPAPRWAPPTQRVWGPLEILAVLGLTVGTFVLPVVGPLIGMVCAWLSTQWTRREKVVATIWALLPVVLLVAAALLLLVARSSEPLGVVPMPVSSAIPVPAAT